MSVNGYNEGCSNCVDCINRAPIFNLLSNEELTIINSHRTEVIYKKGELIHKRGTQSSHVISFKNGLAKLYLEDLKGNDKIIRLIKPNDFIVSPGLFIDNRHHFSIKALSDSVVCMIESEAFKQIMEHNTKFAFEYISVINANLLQITEKMHNLVRKNNTGRIAETILYLEKEIYKTNPFKLNLSSTDLADLCGIGRDSTIRMLNNFNDEGIIEYNKESIKIIDRDRLTRISNTG